MANETNSLQVKIALSGFLRPSQSQLKAITAAAGGGTGLRWIFCNPGMQSKEVGVNVFEP